MKKYFVSILILLLLGCVAMRREKKLEPSVKEWYSLHCALMGNKIPEWIVEGNYTEADAFLFLPKKAQQMYIELFWEVRQEGLEELFYSRVEEANTLFRAERTPGWKTDRGRILILCGHPRNIQWYRNGKYTLPNEMASSGQGYTQVWMYWQSGLGTIHYTFTLMGVNSWRRSYNIMGNQMMLERKWYKIFAPTEEGYDMIASWVLKWVKNKEKQ